MNKKIVTSFLFLFVFFLSTNYTQAALLTCGGDKNEADCTTAGGTVVTLNGCTSCSISGTTCPGGMTQYLNWTYYTQNSCGSTTEVCRTGNCGEVCKTPDSCKTPSSSWLDSGTAPKCEYSVIDEYNEAFPSCSPCGSWCPGGAYKQTCVNKVSAGCAIATYTGYFVGLKGRNCNSIKSKVACIGSGATPVNTIPNASITDPISDPTTIITNSLDFTGTGSDIDPGDAITGYGWYKNGTCTGTALYLGSTVPNTSNIPFIPGTWTIGFRVKDSYNAWSDCETRTIINNSPDPVVTVSAIGSGAVSAGTVKSSPTGIDCSINNKTYCDYSFPKGTSVTLTATAGLNSGFDSWSGDCAGTSNICILNMDINKNVTAKFKTCTSCPASCWTTCAGTVCGNDSCGNVCTGKVYCCSDSTTAGAAKTCIGQIYTNKCDGTTAPGTKDCTWREVAP